MKKGDILEGIIERVDFPNKEFRGRRSALLFIRNEKIRQRADFWRYWRNLR